jgi:hypothetical protein
MPRPAFLEHEPACRRELRRRGFRADHPRIADEGRCNAGLWSLAGATNEGIDAQLRLASLQTASSAGAT